MEEAVLFAEGPVKITTAWITGGGRDIPFPQVSAAFVRVSSRSLRLVLTGLALGVSGLVAFAFGSMCPGITESPLPFFLLGVSLLVWSMVVFIKAAFQAYPLHRELVLTVSGRNVSLVTSTNLALLVRAAEVITGSLHASGVSSS